jgi:hypothetical protein
MSMASDGEGGGRTITLKETSEKTGGSYRQTHGFCAPSRRKGKGFSSWEFGATFETTNKGGITGEGFTEVSNALQEG